MGQTIFGGQKQQSQSSNLAYPSLQKSLTPNVSNGTQAGGQMANMLGLNGAPAQGQGFDNWKNSTGYQFGLDQGTQAITGNAATQGLLNSGGTLKAMDTYGQNYASTKYGDYMGQLQNLLGAGNQSAGVISGAGGVTSSSGSQSPGIAKFIGQMMSKGA